MILVGGPVRNRAWALPRYLGALQALEYPPERLGFCWIVNDSADETWSLLQRFREEHASRYASIEVIRQDFGVSEPDTDGARRLPGPRRRAYVRLAELRNRMLERARGYDALFSVDSDVLVRADTLRGLVPLLERAHVAAALLRNHTTLNAWNFLQYDPATDSFQRDPRWRRERAEAPFRVGLTGAVALYGPRACAEARFAAGTTGEDEGFARSAQALGLEQWIDPRIECRHLLSPTGSA